MESEKNDDQGSDMATTPPNPDQRSINPSDPPLDEEKGATSPKPGNVRRVTGFKWFLFILSTLTSMFIYALDNTIVADIVPAIVGTFGEVENLPWLSVGFVIGGVAVVMPVGKLYGLYDAKWVYVISNIIFLAASALCGGAPNMTAEIIGRVFAGAGGNGMYMGLLTLISVNTTNQERPAYLSLSGLVWSIGTVLGPVVGGGFEIVNWRWAFYINLIFGACLLPVYVFVLPSADPSPGVSLRKRAATMDFVGAILSIAAFVTIIMAISFGGELYKWNSGQIIALFVVSGMLWLVFAAQQVLKLFTTAERRMFPVHLLRNKEAILLFICSSAAGSICYITVYYIPIYFQFTQGDTAIKAAVRLLPYIFILSVAILSSGAVMSKAGYYQPWYVIGSILALVGGVLLSRIDTNTSASAIYGFEVLVALGGGAYTQAGFAVIQAVVDSADMTYAITFMLIAQLSGLAFGLAIAGAVFLNVAQNQLAVLLPNVSISEIQQVITGTSSSFFNTLPLDTRDQALDIIISALSKTFIGVYAAAAASLVCSVFMDRKRAYLSVTAAG